MVDTRSGRRGRSDFNPIEQIATSIQALTARMDQQQELILRQQQTIQQLNEILAKREQEKEQGSSVRIERGNENEPEVTPQAHPSQLPPPPPPPPSGLHEQEKVPTPQLTNTQALNQFRKYNPPEFDGKFDVQKAETWLMKMEKIFDILEVTDYQKVILATFTFTDEAEHWWRNTKGVLQVRNVQLTWESFLAEFYEKYCPRSIQDEKETEFINLKQEDGDMSVDTYVAKFIQLSRYSSYLKKCDDEPWKTEKLERGFKPEIRDRVAPQQIRVFNKLVEIARITENNLKRMGSTPKVSLELKRPREEESSFKNNKKNGRGPWNKKGASHSFISYDCVKRLGLTINVLPYDLSISTPTGMKIVTSDVCLNCIVQFNHCYTTIDLICMPFHELDVIIG
ncbi:putative TIR-NBS-LRR resistance protein [Senna tora]|uniref:Putative TIR-NBS-LRR resistance protein n=1 Tax=Senna tora TaxID=362788 RepID=A0A834SZS0_9FABA|nr:putative TIR-NBS-LRR resistance protein [Senna tora]